MITINTITKTHALYGAVRFILDYDNNYKPIASDVVNITGNNTSVTYNSDSLLERRELYNLIESSDKNLVFFDDWMYSNYDSINQTTHNSMLFRNEAEILANITLEDFACIDIHPFSCNSMYEARRNKLERTNSYNAWCNNFPADELIKFRDVDFNKPVFVWYHFEYLKSYDIENLLKATSDKVCDYLATDDKNFNSFKITGKQVNKYNEGKIYVFMCNIEETNMGPF